MEPAVMKLGFDQSGIFQVKIAKSLVVITGMIVKIAPQVTVS